MGIIKRVLVVGVDSLVGKMFQQAGYHVSQTQGTQVSPDIKPDLLCFTGGADIDPKLYNEPKLEKTYISKDRDDREVALFEKFSHLPKVGICRGGQLLNVLSGGAMWQHVNNHTDPHWVTDLITRKDIWVTSTHHQMMIPGPDGEVLAIANKKLATEHLSGTPRDEPKHDTEIVWYEKTQSLCFQPHPEYHDGDCRKYFLTLVDKFLL